MRTFFLADEAATGALGAALSRLVRPGAVFALSGPLGSGKTCVARGLITGLAPLAPEEIVSPTFTLVQNYPTGMGMVWHFDLYRLKQPDEVLELGLEEALAGEVSVIEWPERMGPWLPRNRIDVTLAQAGNGRQATVVGRGTYADAVGAWRPGLDERGPKTP